MIRVKIPTGVPIHTQKLIWKVCEYVLVDLLKTSHSQTRIEILATKRRAAQHFGMASPSNNVITLDGFMKSPSKSVKIRANNLVPNRIGDFLVTLCHELVHTADYISGDLRLSNIYHDMTLWKGEEYVGRTDGVGKKGYQTYRNLPWEIKARKLEQVLAKKVVKKFPEILEIFGDDDSGIGVKVNPYKGQYLMLLQIKGDAQKGIFRYASKVKRDGTVELAGLKKTSQVPDPTDADFISKFSNIKKVKSIKSAEKALLMMADNYEHHGIETLRYVKI